MDRGIERSGADRSAQKRLHQIGGQRRARLFHEPLGAQMRVSRTLPADVVVEELDPRWPGATGQLFAQESALVAGAVAKRRREFETGRILARRGLARMGIGPSPILTGSGGVPRWPPGVVGSITHCRTWCAVALGLPAQYRAVGIDAEVDAPVAEHLWPAVCTAPELRFLDSMPPSERGRWCRAIFSAKESAYKAQFPISRTFLPPHAMTLDIDVESETFEARFNVRAAEFRVGHRLFGAFTFTRGLIATAVTITK